MQITTGPTVNGTQVNFAWVEFFPAGLQSIVMDGKTPSSITDRS
jgi:hypothetical protein